MVAAQWGAVTVGLWIATGLFFALITVVQSWGYPSRRWATTSTSASACSIGVSTPSLDTGSNTSP